MKLNKKGNIQDIPFIMVVLLIFAIFAIFAAFMYDEVATLMIDSNSLSPEANDILNQTNVVFAGTLDGIGPLLMIGLLMGVIALAFLVRSQPHFAIIGIFVVGIFIFVGAVISNVFFDATQGTAGLTAMADNFTFTNFLLSNLPIILAGMLLVIGVVFYAKSSG